MTRKKPQGRIKQFFLLLTVLCIPMMPVIHASASEEDDLRKLDLRFGRAYKHKLNAEAAQALTEIAARSPTLLRRYPSEIVFRTATPRPASSPQERAARLALTQRLFALHYTGESGIEPTGLWLALVSELVDDGRVSEAVEVVPRIQTARAAVALRVDKRFEALMRVSPNALSVESIAKLDVLNRQAVVQKYPRSIDAILRLGDALVMAGEFQQALEIADAALAKVAAAKSPRSVYDDAGDMLTWLYQNRVDALRALGRWNEAEVAGRKSMELPERGGGHVNNTINLAGFYIQAGRADDAVATLRSVIGGRDVSPYGLMQIKGILCRAAVIKNEESKVRQAMDYMSQHRNDAPRTYQSMLLWTNNPDAWAQYMIERLHDPRMRRDALLDLQIYTAVGAQRPSEVERQKRFREFADRPDVRAAVQEVGVIETFSIFER